MHSNAGTQFSINAINVIVREGNVPMQQHLEAHTSIQVDEEFPTENEPEQEAVNASQFVPVQISVMAPIDHEQPDVNDEFEESRNVNEIVRKTKDNIVNVNQELKAEEFSWFYLFPYGKNGLNEKRPVKITPLDYFQQRILGLGYSFSKNRLFVLCTLDV